MLLCTCTVEKVSSNPSAQVQSVKELPQPISVEKPSISLPPLPIEEPIDEFQYCESFTYQGTVHHPGLMTEAEQRYTFELCKEYGLEYEIVLSLMGVEANWNLYIRSTSGYASAGSISIRYHYDRMLSLGLDLNDPLDGIECICVIMAEKLNAYGDYSLALMAYNKGDAGAQKYFNKGVYSIAYTEKVLGFAEAIKNERIGK